MWTISNSWGSLAGFALAASLICFAFSICSFYQFLVHVRVSCFTLICFAALPCLLYFFKWFMAFNASQYPFVLNTFLQKLNSFVKRWTNTLSIQFVNYNTKRLLSAKENKWNMTSQNHAEKELENKAFPSTWVDYIFNINLFHQIGLLSYAWAKHKNANET